jgi:hypothetical protein
MRGVSFPKFIYWTVFYFLPFIYIYYYSISSSYKLSNFSVLFSLYVIIYIVSLFFLNKLLKLIQFTFARVVLTIVAIPLSFTAILVFVVLLETFLSPFNIEFNNSLTNYIILKGAYSQPPLSDDIFMSFGSGYGTCPDLTFCTYISKEHFLLIIILFQLIGFAVAILLERAFHKIAANRWEQIRIHKKALIFAALLAILPITIEYITSLRYNTIAGFQYKTGLSWDFTDPELYLSLVGLIVTPFLIFCGILLFYSFIFKKLGIFSKVKTTQTVFKKVFYWFFFILNTAIFCLLYYFLLMLISGSN